MTRLSHLTVDQLAEGICLRAGRIAAAEAELLLWIAEFDRRGGWAGPGMLSCAHWLSWRTGLSPGAARERVRVAHRLEELPDVATAYGEGSMSWSQVRAVTRVADPGDGVDWVELAQHSSAAQLERVVRGIRRARAVEEAAADPEGAAWSVRTRRRYDDDGNLVLTVYAGAEAAPLVEAAFEAKRAELERERAGGVPAGTRGGTGSDTAAGRVAADGTASADRTGGVPAGTPEMPRVTEGEALLAMAQDVLDAERRAHPDVARRRRARLTAQVDPLSGWGRLADGEVLPPTSLRAVVRTLPGRQGPLRLRPVTPADLRRHDLGRTSRLPSPALRDLLGTLDGERCRFPGCTRHRTLHAHHVALWSEGGPTDLDNLVLLCSRHHTLVHAQGFALVLHPDRRLEVRTADGVAVLHHPALPWGDPAALDPERRVTAESLPSRGLDARMDLGYVVSVLLQQAA